MKKLFFYLLACSFLTTAIISCHRNNDDEEQGNTTTAQDGFYYFENGATTQTKADKAFATGSANTIVAQSADGKTGFEINLTGLSKSTYTIGSSNHVTYYKSGASGYWVASGGSVVIMSNASGKLTGTFDVQGTGITGITRVSGTFTNLTIN